KPIAIGGAQGGVGGTGRGCTLMAREAARPCGIDLGGARPGIQGVGNVGGSSAAPMRQHGAKVIVVSEGGGGLFNPNGLDIPALLAYKARTGSIAGFPEAEPISNTELLELPCEILIPAALDSQITEANAPRIKARVIV